MENKKNLWLFASVFVFLTLLVTILFLSLKKKETTENILPTKTPLPTTVLVQKRPALTPTMTAKDIHLSLVKNKLINGYKFEDIILDYRQKSDLIIVFYSDSKDKAQEQVKKFFEEEGVSDFNSVKLEYVGLRKDPEEPPAGYFR